MSEIGPGDWVECVEDDTAFGVCIVAGALYRIEEIDTDTNDDCTLHGPGCPGACYFVYGAEISEDRGWCSLSFRPIRDGQERITRKTDLNEPA